MSAQPSHWRRDSLFDARRHLRSSPPAPRCGSPNPGLRIERSVLSGRGAEVLTCKALCSKPYATFSEGGPLRVLIPVPARVGACIAVAFAFSGLVGGAPATAASRAEASAHAVSKSVAFEVPTPVTRSSTRPLKAAAPPLFARARGCIDPARAADYRPVKRRGADAVEVWALPSVKARAAGWDEYVIRSYRHLRAMFA